MSRRRLALAAIPLVLAIAYGLYWFHAAGLVRKSIAAWSEARRAEGWRVEYLDLAVDGFPWRIQARLRHPVIALPNGSGWSGEALSASASPFDLRHVHVDAAGRHGVDWQGWHGEVDAGQLGAEISLDGGGRLAELGIACARMAVDVPGWAKVAADTLSLNLSATGTFNLALGGVDLPPLLGRLLERRVAVAEMSGHLKGAWPGGAPLPALAAWSRAGGAIEIERLAVEWAPMAVEAEGTMALDGGLQPLAAFSARVRGFAPLVDRLADGGMIDTRAVLAAKTVLALLAKPDSRGRPAVQVPVTVQSGQVWLGPAKVATLPAIAWPAGMVLPIDR